MRMELSPWGSGSLSAEYKMLTEIPKSKQLQTDWTLLTSGGVVSLYCCLTISQQILISLSWGTWMSWTSICSTVKLHEQKTLPDKKSLGLHREKMCFHLRHRQYWKSPSEVKALSKQSSRGCVKSELCFGCLALSGIFPQWHRGRELKLRFPRITTDIPRYWTTPLVSWFQLTCVWKRNI